jgi:uncharacterized protein
MEKQINLLFNGGLGDFLPKAKRGQGISFIESRTPSVKDLIEAQGVPHPEVGQILFNGAQVSFAFLVVRAAQIEVFPVQPETEGQTLPPLQLAAPRPLKFVLDVHLGKLARYLRLLGFDAHLDPEANDQEIARKGMLENRVILTRDVGLLKQKSVIWGYWLRSQNWQEQVQEILRRYGCFGQITPFTRCMVCNGVIAEAPKEQVHLLLPPKTRQFYDQFYQCATCQRVYWQGSHYEKMQRFISSLAQDTTP